MVHDSSAFDSRYSTETANPYAVRRPSAHFAAHSQTPAPSDPRPPLSAPGAVNPTIQSAFQELHNRSSPSTATNDAWLGRSRETDRGQRNLPRLTEPYNTTTEASTFQAGQYARHTTNSWDPRQPTDTLRCETSGPCRQSLHDHDRRRGLSVSADAPHLTLHIPLAPDLPRISTQIPHHVDNHHYHHPVAVSSISTSLPSFAAFNEHNTRANDVVGGPEITPMSERLSCYNCSRWMPLVKEVTTAVAELDETIQSYCNRSIVRTRDAPRDDSFQAVQWIIDTLRNAKTDLQDAARRNYGYFNQHQSNPHSGTFRNTTPPHALKRPGEQWDRDDFVPPKRPRSGGSSEYQLQLPSLTPRDDRRGSLDFAPRDSRFDLTPPPPSGSVPGSAHPRTTSPMFTHRTGALALPSPSSMAYPPSQAPSLAPQAPSVGSPATSYQPASSIHTGTSSSATSAHTADLQHQVSLKTLELQTLQSEYASLLRKFQRERLKSQAIEKKTSVADQEVNDLTGKNEELIEQVKNLETALEECEKKRDTLSVQMAREKEQWGRMLDQSVRLHTQADSERTRLLEEKRLLEGQLKGWDARAESVAGEEANRSQPATAASSRPPIVAVPSGKHTTRENKLDQEVMRLNERIESLHAALKRVQRSNDELVERTQAVLKGAQQSQTVIEAALGSNGANERDAKIVSTEGFVTAPPRPVAAPLPTPPTSQQPTSQPLTVAKVSNSPRQPGTLEVFDNGKRVTARLADVARAVTPGPEELGFTVTPTTLGPEELIKALGPVPPATTLSLPPPRNIFDTPGSVSAMHSSHGERGRRTAASPRAYHSSPPEMIRRPPASASGSISSPEAYASDPEIVSGSENKAAQAHSVAPPSFSPHRAGPHASSLADSFHTWRSAMPPPP